MTSKISTYVASSKLMFCFKTVSASDEIQAHLLICDTPTRENHLRTYRVRCSHDWLVVLWWLGMTSWSPAVRMFTWHGKHKIPENIWQAKQLKQFVIPYVCSCLVHYVVICTLSNSMSTVAREEIHVWYWLDSLTLLRRGLWFELMKLDWIGTDQISIHCKRW